MVDLIPADSSTRAIISVGSPRYGTIETVGDIDWYKVTLNAGNYHINVGGDPLFGNGLFDPQLRIYNSAGVEIGFNDDAGAGRDAYLDFTAASTGVYYIAVKGYTSYVGDYAVNILTNQSVPRLDFGTSITNRITDTNYERDQYLVRLEAQHSYTITVAGESAPGTALVYHELFVDDAAGNNLVYRQSSNGTTTYTFTPSVTGDYRLSVRGNVDNGYYSLVVNPNYTFTQHRPVGQNATGSLAEDSIFNAFSNAMFPFSDADGDSFGGIVIASLPTVGSLTLSGSAVYVGQSIPRYAFSALQYTPPPNYNGTASLDFEVYAFGDRSEPELTTHKLTFNISAVNDAPVIGSGGGGSTYSKSINENGTGVITVNATDVDSSNVTYAIAGSDAGLFTINASTGALTFKAAPDFETPKDSGRNNVYDITVIATDGALTDTQILQVSIANVAGNTIAGTSNADTVDATHAIASKAATSEEDTIDGKQGNDRLDGLAGNDTLIGGDGNDTLIGGAGKDRLAGGNNTDTADYSEKTVKVEVALNKSTSVNVKVNGSVEDSINNIEYLIGGSAGDKFTGDSLANKFSGNKGNDTLIGGSGNDTLIGGAGKDSLDGGSGADKFLFNATLSASTNVDTIVSFTHDSDIIQLEDAIFKAIGSSLSSAEFYAATGATKGHDADDRIIYDKSTGRLYYDADGTKSGGLAAIHFATLTNKPSTLDHGDFAIV